MLKRLGALLVLAALVSSGCSAEPIPESEKILIESSSSPLGPSSGKGAATKDKAAKPKGKKKASQNTRVVAQQSGVSLIPPSGWTSIGEGDLAFAADSPRGRELAGKLGMSAEQLGALLETTDLFLLGLPGNLSVSRLPQSQLPSEDELRSGIAALGDVSDVSDVNTPLGGGRQVSYSINGATTQYGDAVFVAVDGAIVQVTVTTRSAGESASYLSQSVATLKRA